MDGIDRHLGKAKTEAIQPFSAEPIESRSPRFRDTA
jgi:hypothetical protein